MERYLGVKLIQAEPMNLGDYNEFRGWTITEDEDPNREGYKVAYQDGYVSWSPKEIFEEAYRRLDNLTFGLAIEALKKGYRVAREGWNGKGMFLSLIQGRQYALSADITMAGGYGQLPFITMKTADDKIVPWLASQTDMLAEDWVIIE